MLDKLFDLRVDTHHLHHFQQQNIHHHQQQKQKQQEINAAKTHQHQKVTH